MSFFGDFIGGAAAAGEGILGDQIKAQADFDNKSRMAKIDSDLAANREATRIKLTQASAEELAVSAEARKNQPANDYVTALASNQGLTEAAPITSLTGYAPDSGHQTTGLSGDLSSLKKPAGFDSWADEDKKGYMAQLQSQVATEQAASTKTQPMSQSGIINATMKQLADSGNGAAYERGLAMQGKDAVMTNLTNKMSLLERQIDNRERSDTQRNEDRAERTRIMEEIGLLKAERGGVNGANGDAKITREERLRYTTLFSDAGKRLSEAQTALGNVAPGKIGEAERASLQESVRSYKEERSLYQGLLAESQSPNAPKAPEKAKPEPSKPITALPSGAKQVGTSGGKPVFQTPDGKRFIGN